MANQTHKLYSIDIDALLEMLRESLTVKNITDVCHDPFVCCIHDVAGSNDDIKYVEDFDWILKRFESRLEAHIKAIGVMKYYRRKILPSG